ncbi:hypothetical protein B0H13DRAFT_2309828 [Mycena leptocephala]|nr:hypothetical protein B0H13DRAFT_2309828 [Mycena leptocephala]
MGVLVRERGTSSNSRESCLFDELQKVIFKLTGKHLRFKRFTPGGNLITLGVDMEAAQVQGACDSFLPTNEPEYSGIATTDPDEFALYCIRACISHAKRGVHALKIYVTDEQFTCPMEFPYMKTQEQIDDFTMWIAGLNLIKSQSPIHPDDWDITDASTNEGQHHWINQQTGVKLTPLEAIESARKVNFKTAREVKDSLGSGALDNSSNNLFHRMSRKVQRTSRAISKARATNQSNSEADELEAEYEEKNATKRVAEQDLKDLKSRLSLVKGTKPRKRGKKAAESNSSLLEATSSGRVLTSKSRLNGPSATPFTGIVAELSIFLLG